MSERVASFFELIADSSVFEAAFKKAKVQAGEFAAAFTAASATVEADANKMGLAIERGIATGSLSRTAANQMIAQRLAFYGGGAAATGGAVAGAERGAGGLSMNAGMFGLYAGLGAVGAIGAGAGLLTEQIGQYAAHASAVLRDSEAIGINAQQLQTWQAIAKIVGLDEQSMTLDFERFSKNLAEGAPALKATGLSLKDLGITSTNAGQAILQLSDWFHNNSNEAQKNAVASALFGRSGMELVPILNQGSAAFQNYENHLQSIGALLSNSDLVMGARAQTAIQNLGEAFDSAKNRLIAAALPGFTAFFNELSTLLSSNGQLWTEIGSVVSNVVSFIVGVISGLSGVSVDLSKPPTDAAAAYEGLGGAAKDASAGIDGTAGSTKSLTDAITDQINALQDEKRAQDDLYDAQKSALQDQLDTLHDVTDTRRHQGEDIVTYERRLAELGIQDKIKAVDKAKSAYDRQVDDHITALRREQQAVKEAAGTMGNSLADGISGGMNLGLSSADQVTAKLNQKFVDFGVKFAATVKGWFKLLTGDQDLMTTVNQFGQLLGDDIGRGIVQGVVDSVPGSQRADVAGILGKWFGKIAGHAGGYYGSAQHLAWISEGNSTEVVLPVSDRSRSLALMEQSGMAALARSAGGSGGAPIASFVVNFNGPVATEMVANQVMTKIDREMRKRGFNNGRGFGTG